jgi:hypothetical protein
MDNITELTFHDDDNKLGGRVYINRRLFSEHVDHMSHTELDQFNSFLDQLIEANRRAELRQLPFVSFEKPADFDQVNYCEEPMGSEHAEMRAEDEYVDSMNAIEHAKRHYRLMWYCGHPEEVAKLERELNLSAADLAQQRRSTEAQAIEYRHCMERLLRQIAEKRKRYSSAEIAEANPLLDEIDADSLADIDGLE